MLKFSNVSNNQFLPLCTSICKNDMHSSVSDSSTACIKIHHISSIVYDPTTVLHSLHGMQCPLCHQLHTMSTVFSTDRCPLYHPES